MGTLVGAYRAALTVVAGVAAAGLLVALTGVVKVRSGLAPATE